ncbi:cell wall assembly protein [Paenibacillus sp. FSL R7-0273]|uniref:SMI1/KNR4 family protein n=1 Tax=Paenibacillus sp. FSL R7-0273 TaxID=1536772 RepID=UPI0004F7AC3A|nr:SMI1/KNR4 family protein [Paenibacillus sp. FSL R7-0273]AIQ45380.1 cell wall assembly protein [Paenibacillus sp. FSL R7-0273]OMF89991.1 cell wall assembly protein [Paenibacillus sp. FSL R7-0273]
MSEQLVEQLELWHEEDEFEEIVDAVMEIPGEDRDYVLVSHLGRALLNLERYEDALEQLMSVEEEGEDDPLWHYRVGFSYYYLKQYDKAVSAFETADELEPEDEDTLEFLALSRRKAAKKAARAAAAEASSKKTSGLRPLPKFDGANFWADGAEGQENYVSEPLTDELIESVQEQLVFKLPDFYIAVMKQQNGGVPRNTKYPLGNQAAEAGKDHIVISGIRGIGRDKKYSLCGEQGSLAVIDEWNYPEFGVVICDAPSADQGVVMLDYRPAGNDGEPEVVYVDLANNHKVTYLAKNVESFIRGLVSAELA